MPLLTRVNAVSAVFAGLGVVGGSLLTVGTAWSDRSDLALEVYRRSGTQEQLRDYPRNLEAFLTAKRDEIPPRMYQAMQKALRAAGDSVDMDSTFLVRLRGQMGPTTTRYALTFLDSSLGKAVTDAERKASTPEGLAGAEGYFKNQDPTQGEPARTRLLRVLDTAVGSSDLMTQEMLAMNHALAVAMDATRPPNERHGAAVLWDLIRQGEPQTRAEAQQQTLAAFLYTYRMISKEELREYIRFATSEEGLDYHRVMIQVLLQSLMEFDAVMSRVLVREMATE